MDQASTDYICTLLTENEQLKNHCTKIELNYEKLSKEFSIQGEKMGGLQIKIDRLTASMNSLEKDLVDERSINAHLVSNQQYLSDQITSKNEKLKDHEVIVSELKEQVRDLMFFLETQSKVEQGKIDPDLKNGSVLGVSPSPPNPQNSPSPKKNKSRRK